MKKPGLKLLQQMAKKVYIRICRSGRGIRQPKVFKNATNSYLIGRFVLASHPETKQNFEALMGNKEITNQTKSKKINYASTTDRGIINFHDKISKCQTAHCNRSSDDDSDEIDDQFYEDDYDDKFNDNSAAKGCWAKNKTKTNDGIHTKVPVNMDRNLCKTKKNNSIEKELQQSRTLQL